MIFQVLLLTWLSQATISVEGDIDECLHGPLVAMLNNHSWLRPNQRVVAGPLAAAEVTLTRAGFSSGLARESVNAFGTALGSHGLRRIAEGVRRYEHNPLRLVFCASESHCPFRTDTRAMHTYDPQYGFSVIFVGREMGTETMIHEATHFVDYTDYLRWRSWNLRRKKQGLQGDLLFEKFTDQNHELDPAMEFFIFESQALNSEVLALSARREIPIDEVNERDWQRRLSLMYWLEEDSETRWLIPMFDLKPENVLEVGEDLGRYLRVP